MFFLCPVQYVYHIGAFGQCLAACARCSGGLGGRTARSRLVRVTEAEQSRGGQEPVCQSETKACFMIRGTGWNSSELTSPPKGLRNTRLQFQRSHPPWFPSLVSLCFILCHTWHVTSFRQRLSWLSTRNRSGMPRISGVVALATFCSIPTLSLLTKAMCGTVQRSWVRLILPWAVYVHTVCPPTSAIWIMRPSVHRLNGLTYTWIYLKVHWWWTYGQRVGDMSKKRTVFVFKTEQQDDLKGWITIILLLVKRQVRTFVLVLRISYLTGFSDYSPAVKIVLNELLWSNLFRQP